MSAKILVVDDSATDRIIIKNMLSEYNILIACDGLEAMREMEAHTDIDLMILDLNMPNMDGFQVLAALKSNDRYKKLRTIILTNYDELDNELKGLKLGAVDYIRKPIHMDSLKVRIDIHIELLKLQQLFELKLDEQGLTFDTIFLQAPIGIAISHNSEPFFSDTDNVVQINPEFEKITGRTKEELEKLGWARITHPDDVAYDIQNFKKLQSGEIKSYSMEKRYIRPDGSFVWVDMVVASLTLLNEHKYNHICLVQDISDRKANENNLKYNNEHDLWTGLYNRRYLENLLTQDAKMESTQRRAVVGINLSAVYRLSLTYGFHYSQEVIRKSVEALSLLCNERYQLFNTYENRFVFYIKEYQDKNELAGFCKRVVATLKPVLAADRIGGGIGIVEIDEEIKHDFEQLFKKLLIASEKAFHSYDNELGFCFFDTEMEDQIMREEAIKRELERIETDEKNGGLFLEYQPILDLESNQICGFEALARLKSDKLGFVAPLEFIPIAERTKLIIPLGQKVLFQALRFLNKLKNHGYGEISVSINISAIQLLKEDFNQNLFHMLSEMKIDPATVGLEITESMFADNYHEINRILGELKESGIDIAIDDFGTGYSSLSRERELNVNSLKIDKYFIDKLLTLTDEEAITGDIISMAHKLGHRVIAEGVEHERQKHYLKKYGCDGIQGYLIRKPVDEETAIEMLLQNES